MHKHHHHAESVGQAFTKFGVWSHHGSGFRIYAAVVVVGLLVFLLALASRRRSREAQREAQMYR